ncbi:MAG: hypothetical protein GX577_15275, partial [Leptolinea sp.]|nr:hypothetical protein [Leptolinea sp.]
RTNRVFLGDFHSLRRGDRSRRWIVRFSGMKELGLTPTHWLDFGNGTTAPVNYVERS